MNVMNALSNSVQTYPVRWTAAVRAFILMLTSFGLNWTGEQIAAVMLFVEAIFAVFVHNAVTPVVNSHNAISPRVDYEKKDS